MKLNQIALAMATIFVAPAAFALTPTNLSTGALPIQLWISGATAPTAAIYGGVRKVCVDADANGVPDDLHVYTEGTGLNPGTSAAGKTTAYACTMNLNGVDNKTIVYHTHDNGSFEAYTPHLATLIPPEPSNPEVLIPNTLRRMRDIRLPAAPGVTNPAVGLANTCSGTLAVPTVPVNNATGDPTFANCNFEPQAIATGTSLTSKPTLPQGGFSDTPYVLNQLNLLIKADIGAIGSEVTASVGQGFGLAVSWPLYRALQVAQAAQLPGCATPNSTIVAPTSTPACQPNISRQQYSSVVNLGAVGNKNASIFPGVPAGPLQVQRRVGTSGTQSASNAFFLNKPCASGTPGGQLTLAGTNLAGTTTFPGGVTATSNAGSSNVKAAINTATNATAMAIGVLSLENNIYTNPAEKFLFVKLNGISPTADNGGVNAGDNRQTSVDGDYEFWYELMRFNRTTADQEGLDLLNGIVLAWTNPLLTDLPGIFPTPSSGAGGLTQSKGDKNGNACSPAVQ